MQQSTVLNSNKLCSIANASHTAEVTITALALRKRLRHSSDIQRTRNNLIRNGEKIVDADYMAFWKSLATAGVGLIVNDENEKPSRFEWFFSMKIVAQAALEGKDVSAERINVVKLSALQASATKAIPVKKQAKVIVMAKRPTTKPAESTATAKDRFVYIPLRKDFCLEFTVPSNLSKEEIDFIKNALERLSA